MFFCISRWPFVQDPLLEKIRKHGRAPPLLTDRGRTKGVPNQRLILHAGPSDRIGSNFTLTAKHLRLKVIRDERIRRLQENSCPIIINLISKVLEIFLFFL